MANPTTTARSAPGGIRLDNGATSKIAFENDPDISLWEIDVTGAGYDGGDEIDTTTMHNTTVKTKAPRDIFDVTPSTFTAAYDPVVYSQIAAQINVPQSITEHFPDGSTLDYFGFLKSFVPNARTRGEMPTAQVTIVPTNYDPVNFLEVPPVMTEVAGT